MFYRIIEHSLIIRRFHLFPYFAFLKIVREKFILKVITPILLWRKKLGVTRGFFIQLILLNIFKEFSNSSMGNLF